MTVYIQHASAVVYKHVIKPLLFRQAPDTVHRRLVYVGKCLQTWRAVRYALRLVSYQNSSVLQQKVHGVVFENPVGLAAGFDKNAELVPMVRSIGFGFGTIGSITSYYCEGNPRPWFYRLPKSRSLVVNVGLANHGTQTVLQTLYAYPARYFAKFPVVVSVAKTNSPKACTDELAIEDYVQSLKKLKRQLRVSIIELNISCPNAYGGEPFTDPERLEKILRATDELKLKKPLWIKMPINLPWPKFRALLKVIVEHDVQGVTIGNLNKDRVTTELADDLPDKVRGNLSGKPTQELSDELIGKTYKAFGNRLVIVGVGGVFTAEDAYRKIALGASLVELITGLIFEGPQLVGEINRDLVTLLQKDGFATVREAIGSAHHNKKEPPRR